MTQQSPTAQSANTILTAPPENNMLLMNRPTHGTGSKYYPVSAADMTAFAARHGFQVITIPGTIELVFGRVANANGNNCTIRILSAIWPDGTARARGKDAIRVQVWARNSAGIPIRLKGFKRVMRVDSWVVQLKDRVDHAVAFVAELPANSFPFRKPQDPAQVPTTQIPAQDPATTQPCCPKCGGPLTPPKQGRKGWFRGCLAFPKCRGLVNV